MTTKKIRIISLILLAAMLFSLTACNSIASDVKKLKDMYPEKISAVPVPEGFNRNFSELDLSSFELTGPFDSELIYTDANAVQHPEIYYTYKSENVKINVYYYTANKFVKTNIYVSAEYFYASEDTEISGSFDENKLCAELAVTKSPVRDAISNVCAMNIYIDENSRPGGYYAVSAPSDAMSIALYYDRDGTLLGGMEAVTGYIFNKSFTEASPDEYAALGIH